MPAGGNLSYFQSRRLAGAKTKEFPLVDNYKFGYRNREDVTNLEPGVLIVGSQNVLTNVSDRVQIRQGYSVDGQTSSLASPIIASFDWQTRGNSEVHLRSGFYTGNADAVTQFRYVATGVEPGLTAGQVVWLDLFNTAQGSFPANASPNFNYASWWNTTESLREALFVNGQSYIFKWNGATTTLLSATATTITKNGTDTWADAGFYVSDSNRRVNIGNNVYNYTGGENTTTLTGVSIADPSGELPGSVIHQHPQTISNSTMTGITSTFANGIIQVMNNQVFLGALNSPVLWLSKVNSFTDYTNSSTRQVGEGGSLILDQNLVGFVVQGVEDVATMYVSAGKDFWYKLTFTDYVSVVGPSGQLFGAVPIKTGKQQGAISQAFISSMKNNTIAVSNEPTIDLMGVMENYLTQIQVKNISDPIKLDIDSYDFTNGSIFYFRYYIYVAIPKENTVRVYNLATNSWEAPQILPISRFYVVDGELYGHSYSTSESYKLFTGYADRVYPGFLGSPIDAKWVFSYQNFGTRSYLKSANYLYVEGYINANTTATATITYELDGCATYKSFDIVGSDNTIVCIPQDTSSLGKNSLGKVKLGGAQATGIQGLPPKFRVEKTFNNTDFFEASISFEVLGTNDRMELLAFGLNASPSTQEKVTIRQA